jgi:hypothetical protein
MQLSLHPAQTNRFPLAGGRGAWGLAAPGSIALPSISSVFSRVGGPPLHASAACKGGPSILPRSDVRTLSFVGLMSGYEPHLPVFGGSTPPSFRVVAFDSYHVVASGLGLRLGLVQRRMRPELPLHHSYVAGPEPQCQQRCKQVFRGGQVHLLQRSRLFGVSKNPTRAQFGRGRYPGVYPGTHPGSYPGWDETFFATRPVLDDVLACARRFHDSVHTPVLQ